MLHICLQYYTRNNYLRYLRQIRILLRRVQVLCHELWNIYLDGRNLKI